MSVPELAYNNYQRDKSAVALLDAVAQYIESGDPSIPAKLSLPSPWHMAGSAAAHFVQSHADIGRSRKIAAFFTLYAESVSPPSTQRYNAIRCILEQVHAANEKQGELQDLASAMVDEINVISADPFNFFKTLIGSLYSREEWKETEDSREGATFKFAISEAFYITAQKLEGTDLTLLDRHAPIPLALAKHNFPKLVEWSEASSAKGSSDASRVWKQLVPMTDRLDAACLRHCENLANHYVFDAFQLLLTLNNHRNDAHLDRLFDLLDKFPDLRRLNDSIDLYFAHRPSSILPALTKAFEPSGWREIGIDHTSQSFAKLLEYAYQHWGDGGSEFITKMLVNYQTYGFADLLKAHFSEPRESAIPVFKKALQLRIERLKNPMHSELLMLIAESYPKLFKEEFCEIITEKSKPLREIAAKGLASGADNSAFPFATELLGEKKIDARLGGAELFRQLADPAAVPILQSALDAEKSEKVRTLIHAALEACGAGVEARVESGDIDLSLADVRAMIATDGKRLKLPKAPWLALGKLSPLPFDDGTALTESELTFVIAKQAKHKPIEAAPDLVPVFAHIERESAKPFVAALLSQWLNSDQAAADRWALTLCGLLGTRNIIQDLQKPIAGWAENSRHKLAEYAAQAISLIPGDEALMVLDTLANRYNRKFRNIGKAARDAFNAAAAARGITPEELGDMVVPTLDFDSEGTRIFTADGKTFLAELGPDFKLSWSDETGEKSWKSLPASAPDEIKTEVKAITKLIREVVKGQTARLESCLVRQRRWPVPRWQELFEQHPVLRSFASRLIWMIYDKDSNQQLTFRRYPNGILATANGEMVELEDPEAFVGLVHPLELSEEEIAAWRDHLGRFKVKPPFPQLDRPVEKLNPDHANRKTISIAKDKTLSAGTFRSRAEKRGWTRGSVADAGSISFYYKTYPGAGFDVYLHTEDFYVGIDPMDILTLGDAYFTTADSVKIGSYEYDEPNNADDPRVLPFGKVSTVVYSETLSDLKAIIGE